jgi:acyl dehydratase
VKEIMDVTGDRNPLGWDEMEVKRLSPHEKIVPQAVAMIYGRLSHLGDKYRPAPGGTLMGLSFWFIKPAQLGDIITSKAKVTAMEERKGKRILTWRAESVNQNGELISVMEFSGSHRI